MRANSTPASLYQARPELVDAEFQTNLVALDVATGQCIGINGTGAFIWNLLKTPRTVAEVVACVLDEFEVDGAEAELDVRELLDQMIELNAVRVVSLAGASTIR